MTSPLDYPAAEGRIVTQGHADICAEQGHAIWFKDGRDVGICPRCAAVTETPPR